jgi:hypothetical protein
VMTIGTIEVSGLHAALLEAPEGAARARIVAAQLLE